MMLKPQSRSRCLLCVTSYKAHSILKFIRRVKCGRDMLLYRIEARLVCEGTSAPLNFGADPETVKYDVISLFSYHLTGLCSVRPFNLPPKYILKVLVPPCLCGVAWLHMPVLHSRFMEPSPTSVITAVAMFD